MREFLVRNKGSSQRSYLSEGCKRKRTQEGDACEERKGRETTTTRDSGFRMPGKHKGDARKNQRERLPVSLLRHVFLQSFIVVILFPIRIFNLPLIPLSPLNNRLSQNHEDEEDVFALSLSLSSSRESRLAAFLDAAEEPEKQ